MKKIKINDKWKFWEEKDAFTLVWGIPDEAGEVNLPYDPVISKKPKADSVNGFKTGYRDGGIYAYAKRIFVPSEKKNQVMMLRIDGAYNHAHVFVNGQLAAKEVFGYTSFYVPLNNFLHYDAENEIRIQVRAGSASSRYYSGAGVYRDVYYLEAGLTYLPDHAVKIRTKNADADWAELEINTQIINKQYCPQSVVLHTVIRDNGGQIAAEGKDIAVLYGNEERSVPARMVVAEPALWNEDHPNLYTCESTLLDDQGNVLDQNETRFGIRTLSVDARRGLRINGQTVNLRGACIHHDSGPLGSATYEEVQYRQIAKLKEAGFNAIRMAHQPMAPAMLKVCDELGMYVMDECFDMWNRPKSDYDFAMDFDEWWEREIEAMIMTDYNHPSVIMYSIGNEIPEIGTVKGAKISSDLCAKIRSLDDTRFTLASINGVITAGDSVETIINDITHQNKKLEGNVNEFMGMMYQYIDDVVRHPYISRNIDMACAYTDIAGYNYMTSRYEEDGRNYPNRVIVGSETCPPDIAKNWPLIQRLPYLIGDFTWTGWDYLGEAGVGIPKYRNSEEEQGLPQLAYSGDMDLTGYRRPVSYYREIVYGLRKDPYIAVQNPHRDGGSLMKSPWMLSDATSSWTWKGCMNQPVVVEVYASGTEVELINNGVSLGRKPAGIKENFVTRFDAIYQGGYIEAICYDGDKELGRHKLYQAAPDRKLTITPETGYCYGKGEWLYVNIELTDGGGILVTDEDCRLSVSVEGGADRMGFCSAHPAPAYGFNEGITRMHKGRAVLVLKRNQTEKEIRIRLEADHELVKEAAITLM